MKKNTSKDTNLSKAKKAKEKKALFGPWVECQIAWRKTVSNFDSKRDLN